MALSGTAETGTIIQELQSGELVWANSLVI